MGVASRRIRRSETSRSRANRVLGRFSRLNGIEPLEERLALYASTTLVDNGPVEQRIDMVFVGDGFIESGLSPYIWPAPQKLIHVL
jgi:hypothetical protein